MSKKNELESASERLIRDYYNSPSARLARETRSIVELQSNLISEELRALTIPTIWSEVFAERFDLSKTFEKSTLGMLANIRKDQIGISQIISETTLGLARASRGTSVPTNFERLYGSDFSSISETMRQISLTSVQTDAIRSVLSEFSKSIDVSGIHEDLKAANFDLASQLAHEVEEAPESTDGAAVWLTERVKTVINGFLENSENEIRNIGIFQLMALRAKAGLRLDLFVTYSAELSRWLAYRIPTRVHSVICWCAMP